MQNKQSSYLLWIVLGTAGFLFLAVSLLAVIFLVSPDSTSAFRLTSNNVGIVELEGIIFDSKTREFNNQLKLFGRQSGIKAVVLQLNSPGGGVAASQEMYEAVKRFREESGKKVVVSMSSVAASGGYYVACAADKIFANPGSITGSIGVIAEWYNYGELLKWAKLSNIVFKSGDLKDSGSPTRPLTESETEYFQNLIDNMYEQFVTAVAASRDMDESAVRMLADGRVFTGLEAKQNGLIDELGTFQDAVKAAAELAGISGEPNIIRVPKKQITLLDILLGDVRSLVSLNPDRSESHIRFQYLWR